MTPARISAAATSEPMTIPAMAPPERLDPDAAAPEVVPVGAAAVDDGKRGGMEVVVGNSTPWHRASTLAFTQHESVELGELWAQKEQRPCKLDW